MTHLVLHLTGHLSHGLLRHERHVDLPRRLRDRPIRNLPPHTPSESPGHSGASYICSNKYFPALPRAGCAGAVDVSQQHPSTRYLPSSRRRAVLFHGLDLGSG